ncbi:MAG: hypothetical protein JW870_12240 [Candidatus Delongbacteria bacterium]|nr:hypothetical protein [Candidatus Delongbacteria bacterium]
MIILMGTIHLLGFDINDLAENEYTINSMYVDHLELSKLMLVKEQYLIDSYKVLVDFLEDAIDDDIKIRFSNDSQISEMVNELNSINFDISVIDIQNAYSFLKDKDRKSFELELIKIRYTINSILNGIDEKYKYEIFRQRVDLALQKYSISEYLYAYLVFDEILISYNYKNMDDIVFFKSECQLQLGELSKAKEGYKYIINRDTESDYFNESFERIILINYLTGESDAEIIKLYRKYEELRNDKINLIKDETHYIAGLTFYKKASNELLKLDGDNELYMNYFELSSEIFSRISEESEYYVYSKFLKANSYSVLKKYDEAVFLYDKILSEKYLAETPENITESCILKKAYIIYNQGETEDNIGVEGTSTKSYIEQALELFNRIPNTSIYHQNALLGKAWIESNTGNYISSNQYIDSLLTLYPDTDLIYESKTLYGYNNDVVRKFDDIISSYEFVLNSHKAIIESNDNLKERFEILELVKENYKNKLDLTTSKHSDKFYSEYLTIKAEIMKIYSYSKSYLEELAKLHPSLEIVAEKQYLDVVVEDIENISKSEIKNIDELSKNLDQLRENFALKSDLRSYIDVLLIDEELKNLSSEIELDLIKSVNTKRKFSSNENDLYYWSDISFVKYILNSLELDDLDQIENTIQELTDELQNSDGESIENDIK